MKTYTCKEFTGFYPVGTAAVVRAENSRMAARLLNAALEKQGLCADATPENMEEFPKLGEFVRILNDGNY